jgi:hypothetical protein
MTDEPGRGAVIPTTHEPERFEVGSSLEKIWPSVGRICSAVFSAAFVWSGAAATSRPREIGEIAIHGIREAVSGHTDRAFCDRPFKRDGSTTAWRCASRRPWLAVLGGPARSASMYRLVNAAAEARRHPAKYARYRFKQPSIARSLRRPWLAIFGRPARSASMPRLVNVRSRCPWASAAAFTNPCTARR